VLILFRRGGLRKLHWQRLEEIFAGTRKLRDNRTVGPVLRPTSIHLTVAMKDEILAKGDRWKIPTLLGERKQLMDSFEGRDSFPSDSLRLV